MIHMNKTSCLHSLDCIQTTDNSEYNIEREVFIGAENIIQLFLQNIYTVNWSLKTVTIERITWQTL